MDHHLLVVMAGWFFAWLLCLLSPVSTVLRMISFVKDHDMNDHLWSANEHFGGYQWRWGLGDAYVQFDLVTNAFYIGKLDTLQRSNLCRLCESLDVMKNLDNMSLTLADLRN